jgi:hypothetical protein
MLGSLERLYTGSTTVGGANSNRVYEATGTSWNAQEINRNALGLAGSESLAMQLYKSAADRAALLPGLQALLGVTADPSERETLANRISIEQTWIANQQVQAQAVAAAAQTQIAGRDQRREEQMQQGIDAILQDAQAHGVAGAAP